MKLMCVVVIAPELGVAIALDQYNQAKKFCEIAGEGWTMVHAFYANMGGRGMLVRIVQESPREPQAPQHENLEEGSKHTESGSRDIWSVVQISRPKFPSVWRSPK